MILRIRSIITIMCLSSRAVSPLPKELTRRGQDLSSGYPGFERALSWAAYHIQGFLQRLISKTNEFREDWWYSADTRLQSPGGLHRYLPVCAFSIFNVRTSW